MRVTSREELADNGTFSRHFSVEDERGEKLESLGANPTLDKIREASRQYGEPMERIDLLHQNFLCTECGAALEERFSADAQGNLLCWDCAMDNTSSEEDATGVSRTTDPTKAVLSNSSLNHKSLCDYVINVATGCSHGCKFCYVPGTPNIRTRQDMLSERTGIDDGQEDWGSYLLYRDDLPERLARKLENKREWKETERGRGVVMLSSGTDCYQDRRAAQITRGCVAELVKHGKRVRILTRSPAVCRDIDLFEASDGLVTVGSSIPSLDDEKVRSLETSAPVPSARLEALKEISEAGVRTYVSMSPTYPTQDKKDLRELLKEFKKLDTLETVFHEPINPRGENFDMTVRAARQSGQEELADELEKLKENENWIEYSINHLKWVASLGMELDIDVHLWPDKYLIKLVDSAGRSDLASHLRWWRDRVSREDFPEQEPPEAIRN